MLGHKRLLGTGCASPAIRRLPTTASSFPSCRCHALVLKTNQTNGLFYECGPCALHYSLALTTSPSVSFRMVRTGKDTQGPSPQMSPLLRVTQHRQRACHRSGSGVFSGSIGSTMNCMIWLRGQNASAWQLAVVSQTTQVLHELWGKDSFYFSLTRQLASLLAIYFAHCI